MNLKWLFATLGVVACLTVGYTTAEDPPPTEETSSTADPARKGPSIWMRTKIKYAEKALSALATSDFEAMRENAERMSAITQLERWARGKDADYQTQLRFFRHANQELSRQASRENLDGATLAFMQVTAACVNCHRHIRDHELPLEKTKEKLTHTLNTDAAFYLAGPQQGSPADGTLTQGTKIRILQTAGSYTQIETEGGLRAFVSGGALIALETEEEQDN
ncbi:MAG: SH3 domain-containing protein [Planctomycetota bacterium]|nr:SH3 domain-containing protein [Planctomycetota bacterium]